FRIPGSIEGRDAAPEDHSRDLPRAVLGGGDEDVASSPGMPHQEDPVRVDVQLTGRGEHRMDVEDLLRDRVALELVQRGEVDTVRAHSVVAEVEADRGDPRGGEPLADGR